MSTHNVWFYGEITKIVLELSPNAPPKQVIRNQTVYIWEMLLFQ